MPFILLIRSSGDKPEAVALSQCLRDNRDSIFPGLDPERGLKAGQGWREILLRGTNRCETVLFIIPGLGKNGLSFSAAESPRPCPASS